LRVRKTADALALAVESATATVHRARRLRRKQLAPRLGLNKGKREFSPHSSRLRSASILRRRWEYFCEIRVSKLRERGRMLAVGAAAILAHSQEFTYQKEAYAEI
jgi:hypothetical protein